MKRYFVIPVILLYMFAACGVLINMHYCGQQLASWNVYLDTDGCGGACGDESYSGHHCCTDEAVTVKISEDHSISSWKYKVSGEEFCAAADVFASNWFSGSGAAFTLITQLPDIPPGAWQGIPLYELFSRLTYYG